MDFDSMIFPRNIEIFRSYSGTSILKDIAALLQSEGHFPNVYRDAVDGLDRFLDVKYNLVLLDEILGTAKPNQLPKYVQVKEPTAIACYVINQLRAENIHVPICVLYNGRASLPKEGAAIYVREGATACIDSARLKEPELLVDEISALTNVDL